MKGAVVLHLVKQYQYSILIVVTLMRHLDLITNLYELEFIF